VAKKTMTLRLDADQAAELEVLARADEISVTDAVRVAIAEHIEARRKDPAFQERIRAARDRERAVFNRLAQ